MLIWTDLADWRRDRLDSLAGPGGVKPGFVPADLAGAIATAPGARLARGMLASGRSAPLLGRPERSLGGWRHLVVVDRAPSSQYDVLLEAARAPAGVAEPIAALALEGRDFHGNRSRPWLAARGNLHLSGVVPVDLDLAASAAAVPALPAVAVIDALAACAPRLSPRLKWVNDIMIGEAKVGGVLVSAQTRGGRLLGLVIGIGLNVAVAPPVAATLSVPAVTCLHDHEAASAVILGEVAAALLESLWTRLEELRTSGAGPLVAAYRAAWGDAGREVAVWAEGLPDTADPTALPPPLARGRALSLTDDLALVVAGAPAPLHGGRLARLGGSPSDRGREPRS